MQVGGGLKKRLEPAISEGLQVAPQFEEAQLPLLAGPQRSPQSRTERLRQPDEEQPTLEVAERGKLGFGGDRGQRELTFPRLEHEFDLPA